MECMDAAAAPPADSSEAAGGSAQHQPQCTDGVRILAVDDDLICLQTIINMSKVCNYNVTTCRYAVDAAEILRRNKNEFDIVLSDLHVPDIDGLALQEIVESEMGLPLIFMSADDGNDNGCDSIIKPLRFEDFKNIRHYVLRKKEKRKKEKSACLENSRGSKEIEERVYSSGKKKRVIWVRELHLQFVEAVKKLGAERAVPKKILELMNAPGITRENVASHLQKYRFYLKKRSAKENQNRAPTHFQGAPNPYCYQGFANYGPLPLRSITTHNFPPRSVTNVCTDITNTGVDNFYNPCVLGIMPKKMQEMNSTPSLRTSSSLSCNALSGHDNSLYQHQANGYLDGTVSEHDSGQQMYLHGVPDHNLHENYMNTAYGTYPHVNSFEVPNLASARTIQGAENVVPNYDTSNEFPQSRDQDRELQNVNHSYGSGQIYITEQNNMGIGPITAYQDFSGTNEQNNTGIGPSSSAYHDCHGHITSDYGQRQGSGQDDLDMPMQKYLNTNTVEEDGIHNFSI